MAKKPSKVKHTVKVGGKWYTLKTEKPFFPEFNKQEIIATKPQMKNLAFGSHALLIEKILAGDPQGHPIVVRPRDIRIKPGFRGKGKRSPLLYNKRAPLSEEYLERKAAAGLDPRPLIATGFYIEHIEVEEEDKERGTLWVVSIEDVEHEPSGEPLRTLAGWLEYGTKTTPTHAGMPARPHWRPVAVLVRNRWKRLPKSIRVDALRETLRRMR